VSNSVAFTSTISQSGTVPAQVIVGDPSATVTITTFIPSGSPPYTSTIPQSGTAPAVVIIADPIFFTTMPEVSSSTSQAADSLTTSTIYTTTVYTVTACPSTIINCPMGHLTTETISLTTTICPLTSQESTSTSSDVTLTSATVTTAVSSQVLPEDPVNTTSTIYTTRTFTITSCHPFVTDCNVGHVTTETLFVSTTICPITAEASAVEVPVAQSLSAGPINTQSRLNQEFLPTSNPVPSFGPTLSLHSTINLYTTSTSSHNSPTATPLIEENSTVFNYNLSVNLLLIFVIMALTVHL
jgi:hypothetical protein